MSQSQRARIARLESRVRHYAAERTAAFHSDSGLDEDGYLDSQLFERLISHAVILAYLIKFGEPKIGERLSEAWKRTGYQGTEDPFVYQGSMIVCDDLRSTVFPGLPGRNLKEKLNLIFETAPAWLIWFTQAEETAFMLDLKLPPDFLDAVKFARSPGPWPKLPPYAFEPQLRGEDMKSSSPLERYYLRMAGLMDTRVSRRQRGRQVNRAALPHRDPVRWPDA
jgi:hypothetical protein